MAMILRWHISRLYQKAEGVENESRFLAVIITKMTKDILATGEVKDEEALVHVSSDNLEWYDLDKEVEIEGYIEDNELIKTIVEKNVRQKSVPPLSECLGIARKWIDVKKERQIEEDMVFLQIFKEEDSNLGTLLNKFKEGNPNQNVGKLLQQSSKWLDFTPQARKMSKTNYHSVLGESLNSNGGPQ